MVQVQSEVKTCPYTFKDIYCQEEFCGDCDECLNGNLHINSDFTHVEILDKNGDYVSENEFGSIVITRLFRGGTPIIRYTGLHDIAVLEYHYCDCGMNTPLLKNYQG